MYRIYSKGWRLLLTIDCPRAAEWYMGKPRSYNVVAWGA